MTECSCNTCGNAMTARAGKFGFFAYCNVCSTTVGLVRKDSTSWNNYKKLLKDAHEETQWNRIMDEAMPTPVPMTQQQAIDAKAAAPSCRICGVKEGFSMGTGDCGCYH